MKRSSTYKKENNNNYSNWLLVKTKVNALDVPFFTHSDCFAPSRPTFYRKRIVSQRKRDGIGNPGQELVYYLPPALCNGKQSLRAKFPTLSHTKQV
jgi:hypothetical protein